MKYFDLLQSQRNTLCAVTIYYSLSSNEPSDEMEEKNLTKDKNIPKEETVLILDA